FTSDHGFGPTVEIFHVNTWLADHGYLTWSDTAESQAAESEQLGIGKIARHAYQLDWEKTTAYASTPSSNGIHIVVANGPDSPGVSPEDYPRFREQLIASLKSFTDGESDVPIVSQIWTREEAFPGPYQHLAPDLTLELRDGGHVSILAADSPLKPRTEIKGTHRPEGIFIAGGRGIRQGVSLPELSILDVPSMLLYCLGLPIPEEFEGRMPTEVFDEARLREQPVRIGESAVLADVNGFDPDEEIVMSPEDEERMVERLRALGYID
ncbi:MAG: alkaline phosphatase family protein, partial [Chloroflexi bacterium]|nr:alkaline phosphatase family protein [Chloroflexota bacterium]